MPRIKKAITPEQAELELPAPEEAVTCADETAIADAPVHLPKVRKPKFKEIHIKDNYWVENDIYQTIADMTKGSKGAKALIINQALKDYLKKNKIAIVPFVSQDKPKKNKEK